MYNTLEAESKKINFVSVVLHENAKYMRILICIRDKKTQELALNYKHCIACIFIMAYFDVISKNVNILSSSYKRMAA
jgi:hypothetical protein